jgi:uncharacterized circularly permuted ATP-grasp superfamily protein/uncharacterized alpha-E superfamily protein
MSAASSSSAVPGLAEGNPHGGVVSGYYPPAGVHDEMAGADGMPRPHWATFLQQLRALGPDEMTARWEKARHLLHENGVSYNVYGDPRGMERPWSLSPVPVLIAPEEWAALSEGVAQRARLLDLLLADLYGPQRALTEGWLPPELVFAHPGFLRAAHGVRVPLGRWLPLYGVDLVRAPDGQWRALADRTQAPSGAGYALENRIVVSRALPDLFRTNNVARLAHFFRTLQESLAALAPFNRDQPHVVVLTPGPYNATYFEQAYLAQYLGYTLTSGGDLTVRDDRVFLKTLSGLRPVDVILRRVNDDFCDPLALRPDSVLGVPGLVEAVRQGHVALANPIGTGLLQTPALLPYLPRLCRHLLGEELQLGSAETFWCGDPGALKVVLDRFDNLVFKPTFPVSLTHPIFTRNLSVQERANLRAEILATPHAWVAQEHVAASTTPLFDSGTLVPRALVLRSYAVSSTDRYSVMPGALARVAGSADNPEISMQGGAGSKDTWVLSSGPVSSFSLLRPSSHPVELSRGGGDLPSRTADNLYWLGRYAERAEGIARLGRVLTTRLQDALDPTFAPESELGGLFRALRAQTEAEPLPPQASVPPIEVGRMRSPVEDQLLAGLFDSHHAGSLVSVGRHILRVARMVRDRVSADTWRVLTTLDDELRDAAEGDRPTLGATGALLNRTVQALAAFSGLASESMTRGQAWRFLDMGRRLERATTLVLLLSNTLVSRSERESPLLEAILDIADSGMTYRRRYLAHLQPAPVVDLLLTDETNPRSVIFQLRGLIDHVEALPNSAGQGMRSPQLRVALAILAELQLADVEGISRADARGARPALGELLQRLAMQIPALSESLSSGYLSHAVASRHLGAVFERRMRERTTAERVAIQAAALDDDGGLEQDVLEQDSLSQSELERGEP